MRDMRSSPGRSRFVGIALLMSIAALAPVACRERAVDKLGDRAPVIQWKDIEIGRGQIAKEGSKVAVHYVGRLPDGSVFMDTHEKGSPHHWTIGDDTVIAGMDLAVVGMRAGGKRTVRIPPSLHWGRDGYAGIVPENAIITFELEMISVN